MSSSRRRAYGDFSCAAQLKSVAWVTRASRLAPCDVRYGVIGGSLDTPTFRYTDHSRCPSPRGGCAPVNWGAPLRAVMPKFLNAALNFSSGRRRR
jgi:hypothetical protein